MRVHNKLALYIATVALLPAAVGAASAQQQTTRPPPKLAPPPAKPTPPAPAPQAQPPAGDAPQRTTASYGDWVLQCVTTNSSPPELVCDIAQVTQLQGKNVPFSRVAVAHPEKGKPVKLVVQVPINVSYATQVRVATADDDPGIAAPFANCTPNGCFAEFELKDDLLKKMHDATSVGKLSFADAAGQTVTVPISFNGFGQAYDALAKK